MLYVNLWWHHCTPGQTDNEFYRPRRYGQILLWVDIMDTSCGNDLDTITKEPQFGDVFSTHFLKMISTIFSGVSGQLASARRTLRAPSGSTRWIFRPLPFLFRQILLTNCWFVTSIYSYWKVSPQKAKTHEPLKCWWQIILIRGPIAFTLVSSTFNSPFKSQIVQNESLGLTITGCNCSYGARICFWSSRYQ